LALLTFVYFKGVSRLSGQAVSSFVGCPKKRKSTAFEDEKVRSVSAETDRIKGLAPDICYSIFKVFYLFFPIFGTGRELASLRLLPPLLHDDNVGDLASQAVELPPLLASCSTLHLQKNIKRVRNQTNLKLWTNDL